MASSRSFSSMLNQHLADKLFKIEYLKRDYVMNRVPKVENWKGGQHQVPFLETGPSSVSFGSLTADDDIAESEFIRGTEDYAESWGTMLLRHTDLIQHDGKIPESTFLRLIPDEFERLMRGFKEAVSGTLINGAAIDVVTDSTDHNTGLSIVEHPERFCKGMKVLVDDDDTATAKALYVTAVDINTNQLTLSDARGGAAYDLSAYTVAQNAKFYWPGSHSGTAVQNSFNSFKGMLLSASNGGDAAIHGQTKAGLQALQAVNIPGASWTGTNIVEKIFDAYTDVRRKCRGNAKEILCSYKHLGSILKVLQTEKGAYQVVKSPQASQYGWTMIEIADLATGQPMRVVAASECNDSEMYFLDWDTFYFLSNGLFKKRKNPENGQSFFEIRATTGFSYVIDVMLFGNLCCKAPSHNAAVYGISY